MRFLVVLFLAGCNLAFGLHEVIPDELDVDAPVVITQNWAAVSVGAYHACGLKTDASAWCWGRNESGQLGQPIGTVVEADRPMRVDATTWSEISTSTNHTCGIRTDNTLWCWGADYRGSLGSNQVEGAMLAMPTQVAGMWSHVAIETYHSCAISSAGALSCWGSNVYGQLGTGMTDPDPVARTTPMQIAEAGPWASVAVGLHATCAIKAADRSLWCWGRNNYGGLGTTPAMSVPTPQHVGTAMWKSVALGVLFTCGITTDGAALCMGLNSEGELGNDTTMEHTTPAPVDGQHTDWVDITTGWFHACGRRSDGTMYCWGSNRNAQLAVELGSLMFRSVPVLVDTPATIAIGSGTFTTCAVQADHDMWCAGNGANGQRGNGTGTHLVPTMTLGPSGANTVAFGDDTACVIRGATARCWGDNGLGGLGDGTNFNRAAPVDVASPSGGAWSMIAPGRHSCGVSADAKMYCWGDNSDGSLGINSLAEQHAPTATALPFNATVQPLWTTVAVGKHSCALSATTMYCWGLNTDGEVGVASTTANPQLVPRKVNGTWKSVEALDTSTCGLDGTGLVLCFGSGTLGELGDGMQASRPTSANVTLGPGNPSVSAGAHHACVPGAPMKCWGDNTYGQLGDQSTARRSVPVPITGTWTSIATVATGANHTCAVDNDGALWCFGKNSDGQLGDGTFAEHHSPTRVGTETDWVQAYAGTASTCATKRDNSLWCWGAGELGQMGDGTAWSATHTLVIVP